MYKQPEGKVVKVDGWFALDDALEAIDEARERGRAERARGKATVPAVARGELTPMTDAVRTPDELLDGLPDFPFDAALPRASTACAWRTSTRARARPCVFVHGEPTWSFLWRKVIPPVRDAGFRCIAPDLRGLRPLGQADRLRTGTPTTATPR